MTPRIGRHAPAWFLAALATLALPLGARAADLKDLDNSLPLIPADAAVYGTMLRNREQFDAVAKSKAWAKLWALPAVQMGWEKVKAEYTREGGQLAPLRAFYSQPENQELVDLIADAVSDEIFFEAGPSFADFSQLGMELAGGMRYGPAMLALQGRAVGAGGPPPQAIAALNVLSAHIDQLKTPELTIGFKLKNADKAEAQLKRLEGLLNGLASGPAPALKGRIKWTEVGGSKFLTVNLDGSQVPWDKIDLKQLEQKEGEYDPLVKKLKELKLTVSLGVKGKYLLLGLGGSASHLARLGGDGPKLAERPEFKPLTGHTQERLTSVGYVSKDLKMRVATTRKDLDDLAELAKTFLGKAPVTDEQRKSIEKDLSGLAADLKRYIVEPGASMAFSFLTARGNEGYNYDYGQQRNSDASKPLTLLDHVGGNPVLAIVGRSKYDPAAYQQLVKWIKVIYGHAEEIGLTHLDEDQKAKYQEVSKLFFPLLKRLDEVTGKMLLPSLADGQGGFVLDARWKSAQWQAIMPLTNEPMPLPELGITLGVSDAALLRKAMGEYREILNDAIDKVRELAPPGQMPEFKIPDPQTAKKKNGTLYFYPLPPILGVDPQVVPTAGLSETVAVLALSNALAERLLTPTPLVVDGGPLADRKPPLSAAVYFNWPALVDAASPWVQMGATRAAIENGIPEKDAADIVSQVKVGLEVLKVLRLATAATYVEGGAQVTHTETLFKDLP